MHRNLLNNWFSSNYNFYYMHLLTSLAVNKANNYKTKYEYSDILEYS